MAEQVWFAGLVVLSNRTERLLGQLEHSRDDNEEAEQSTGHIRATLVQWEALKAAIDVSAVPAVVNECVASTDAVARRLSELADASDRRASYDAMVREFCLQVQQIRMTASAAR